MQNIDFFFIFRNLWQCQLPPTSKGTWCIPFDHNMFSALLADGKGLHSLLTESPVVNPRNLLSVAKVKCQCLTSAMPVHKDVSQEEPLSETGFTQQLLCFLSICDHTSKFYIQFFYILLQQAKLHRRLSKR